MDIVKNASPSLLHPNLAGDLEHVLLSLRYLGSHNAYSFWSPRFEIYNCALATGPSLVIISDILSGEIPLSSPTFGYCSAL
jgi:hypothetical protein